MERRCALSVMGLLVATALAVGMVRTESGRLQSTAEDRLPKPQASAALDADEARRILRTYFMDHYSEASCSAVYADLTHDGVEELLVLTVEDSRAGEPVTLHGGSLDADSFTTAQVEVLRAGADGEVLSIYRFTCGAEHSQWGELYLKKEEGEDYLLWYSPYTGAGRGDFQVAQFSLGADGAVLDRVRERIFFPVKGSAFRDGDADQAEREAFLNRAEALMTDAEPVILCGVIHDPVTGTDGPRRFAYGCAVHHLLTRHIMVNLKEILTPLDFSGIMGKRRLTGYHTAALSGAAVFFHTVPTKFDREELPL